MRIEKLIIQSFRCHERLELPLGPVTLITGPNGSGKSTIQGALEFAFSGRCIWTDERGQGGQLGRDGGNGSVTLVAEGESGTATRSTDGVLSLTWRPSAKTQEAQRELEAEMGCTGERARLALRAGRFFGMSAKDQKSLLYELLNLSITPALVKSALVDLSGPSGLPLAATATALVGGREEALADTGRAHKAAYDERTAVNRIAKTAKAKVKELEAEQTNLVYVDAAKREALIAELADIQNDLEMLARDAGAREAAVRQLAQLKVAVERAQDDYNAKAEGLVGPRPDLDALNAKRAGVVSRLNGLKDELLQTNMELDNKGRDALNRQAEMRRLEAERDKLKAQMASATTCQWAPDHQCPGFALRTKSLVPELERIEAMIATVQPQETMDGLEEKKAELRKRIANGDEVLARVEAQIRNAGRWDKAEWAKAALDQAIANLESFPPIEEDQSSHKGVTLRVRRGELAEAIESAKAWDVHSKRLSEAKRSLEEAEYSQRILNELVPFFAPDGFQARVLREQLDPFVEQVNYCLSKWGLSARYTSDLTVQVQTRESWVDYSRLSDGEQVLVALAHQIAFSHLTRLGIVVIDRIEALDDQRQSVLLSACYELAGEEGGPEHIILLGVRSVAPPQGVPHIELGGVLAVA